MGYPFTWKQCGGPMGASPDPVHTRGMDVHWNLLAMNCVYSGCD